ncbi:MAG: DUF4178 domain-containing protein [Rhodobacteraceae bacterium]|nr:MAG: DUF4178 domain-containing protein [Paracoccaceae bacterium]
MDRSVAGARGMSATAFNCTQCGAGQDLLGGGRVRVHVCGYCGSELDVQDDFRVIAQFRDMVRPETPFDPGMEGTLWGVPFTVIGTIGWIEQYGRNVWTWVDHQVFSPTHGYGWLSVEDGHITFTRKTRDVPEPGFISAATIERSENRPTAQMDGRTYRYYGSGEARPTFIEGAFNYVPSMDERVTYVDLMCGHRMLTMASVSGEREYEITRLPPRTEVVTSFGLDPNRLPTPKGVHPLDTFERAPLQAFVRNVALAGGIVSLLIAAVLWPMGDTIVRSDQVSVDQPISIPFEVTRGDRLTRIAIWADAWNSWAWFEAELLDADGEAVAAFERGVEYYQGREGGESWSEGSQTSRTKLKLDEGQYTLELARTEGEVDWTNGQLAQRMQVTISEGHTNPWWLVGATILLLALGGAFLGQRALHNARRWSGSDWSDD